MPRAKRKKEADSAEAEETAAAAAKKSKTEEGGGDAAAEAAVEEAAAKSPPKGGRKKKTAAATTGAAAAKVNYDAEAMVQNFDHYLFQLLSFKADHNNFHVTKEDNPDLHLWLQFVKKEYKNYTGSSGQSSLLSKDQVKVLEFLHVPVTSRGDEHWNRFYELLREYGEKHGHVLVPRLCEVPGLGDWVTDQRRQYKAFKQGQATQLSRERQEKLEAIGASRVDVCMMFYLVCVWTYNGRKHSHIFPSYFYSHSDVEKN